MDTTRHTYRTPPNIKRLSSRFTWTRTTRLAEDPASSSGNGKSVHFVEGFSHLPSMSAFELRTAEVAPLPWKLGTSARALPKCFISRVPILFLEGLNYSPPYLVISRILHFFLQFCCSN